MAKMFCSEAEAAAALKLSVDDFQKLDSAGTVQRYQDGQKRLYKRKEINRLARERKVIGEGDPDPLPTH